MEPRFTRGTLAVSGSTALRQGGALKIIGPRELIAARPYFGAYNPNRSLAKETLRRHGTNDEFTDFPGPLAPSRLPDEDVVAVIDEPVVWGGGVSDHYGHFLTEFVARLWPLLPDGSLTGLPVVFTGFKDWPFVREWLGAFGVEVMELPERGAVKFKHMYVPQSALQLDAWISPEIRNIHQHARNGLKLQVTPTTDVLWLSRLGLPRDRVPYDEALFEWLLKDSIRTIRPETMPLGEQVAAFEASRAVVGVTGSAFHTAMMVQKPVPLIYLCTDLVHALFVAQDFLLGHTALFVHALGGTSMEPRPAIRRPASFRLMIPETVRVLRDIIGSDIAEADPLLAAVTNPEQLHARVGHASERTTSLDTAIARVMLDPLSIDGRMKLGEIFEGLELDECALEQFEMVADLTNNYPLAPLRAARLLSRLGRCAEAAEMAKRVLAIDSNSKEALQYASCTG